MYLIFVGAEREENSMRNDPDKSEFTICTYFSSLPELTRRSTLKGGVLMPGLKFFLRV